MSHFQPRISRFEPKTKGGWRTLEAMNQGSNGFARRIELRLP
jgi:hypothetical protein